MEEADDGFGALYVDDVEFAASEPAGGLLGCSDSWVRAVGGEEPSGNGGGAGNAGGGTGSEPKSGSEVRRFEVSDLREDGGRREEEEEEGGGSDSEEDLNIVVNDEDCRALAGLSMRSARDGGRFGDDADGDVDGVAPQNGVGMNGRWGDQLMNGGRDCDGAPSERGTGFKQLKFRESHRTGYARANYWRANKSGGMMALSTSARGDFEKNEDQDHKEVSGRVHAHAPSNLAVPQKGRSFSLPWYRNIIDVNIDALKEKPWRYPGVDITDYFNFGLDEESWKQYCSSLEQVRQQRSLLSRIPTYESSSLNQEELVQEGMADGAGQVGSGRTHAPSTTVSLDRQSLLTMQKGKAIEVAESLGERQPSMVLRRLRSYDADVVIEVALPDPPKDYSMSNKNGHNTFSRELDSGKLHVDDSRNTFQPHKADNEDALMPHTVDEDLSVDCLEENARRFRESVKGTRCFELRNASSLVDGSTSGDRKNSDGDDWDSQKAYIQDAEGKAVAEETMKKATQGVCGTSFIADSCIIQAEPSLGDRIQLSLSSLCFESESEASEDSVSVDLGKKDDVYHRNLSFGSSNDFHDSSTCDKASVKTKPTHGTYNPRCRTHFRVGNVGEPDAFSDSDDVASNLSDSRGINEWDDLVVDHSRWNRRQGAIDHSYEEHVPYSRERVYGSERFDGHSIHTFYKLLSRGQHTSRNELDQHFRRSQGEGENFFGGRFSKNGKDLERDGNHKAKCKCMEERNSYSHKELSQLVSRYSTDTAKGKDTQSRLKSEDLQSNKRTNHNGRFLARHKEELMLENCRTSLSPMEWEGDYLENNCGRELLYWRELENFERRGGHRGNPPYGNDWLMELEDECQEYRDHERLSSQLYGESRASEKRRWDDTMSPRDGLNHSRLFGLYRKFRRQSHSDEGGESRRSHVYSKIDGTDDGITFSGNHTCVGRRKYGFQKSLPRRNDDKFHLKHQDDQLHAEEASLFCGRSINRCVNLKYKDADCGMVDNSIKEERNWYRRSSRGNSAFFLNEGFPVSDKTKHDETMSISGNPVNWFVREGKSSRRYNTQRNRRHHVSSKIMDLRVAGTDPTLRYRNTSQRREAAESDLPNSVNHQAGKKWVDKLPVSAKIEDSEIEDDQIGMEEQSTDIAWEKNHVPGDITVTCNVKNKKQGPKKIPEMDKAIGGIDETRIVETIAKMERRKERFKEPLAYKMEVEVKTNHQVNLMPEVTETKHERPARKRRWGGS